MLGTFAFISATLNTMKYTGWLEKSKKFCLAFLTLMSLTISLSLTGCNRWDFAFNWADTYIASKVDDYFDISSQQSKDLKKGLQSDLGSIRHQLIPNWVARLKNLKQEMSKDRSITPLSDERFDYYFAQFSKDVDQINSYFSDTAVTFIASASPQQLEHFAKAFHEKNKEDLEKSQDPKKSQSDYRDKYFQWFEMFLGYLTTDQKNLIEENLHVNPFPTELKIKNKEHIFAQFMRSKDSPDELKKFVKAYYNNPATFDLPEYQSALKDYQKSLQKLVFHILAKANKDQGATLIESLSQKTAQLEHLAAN